MDSNYDCGGKPAEAVQQDTKALLRAAKEALHQMCKAGCPGVDELDEAIDTAEAYATHRPVEAVALPAEPSPEIIGALAVIECTASMLEGDNETPILGMAGAEEAFYALRTLLYRKHDEGERT